MNITYNWLKEYVDFRLSPDVLADLLTMLGLEVEGMQQQGGGMDDVVVARVEEKRQHPNADKLSLCRVNNGKEILDVVCGAQNFKQGDTVALAQIGAVLPGDFKIKRSKIRGEESCGMLCSEKELGLAAESAGIMVLPESLNLGTPVFEALGQKDTLFEIGLTPNRADCLSVIGIAREVAAKLGTTVQPPSATVVEGPVPAIDSISVTIEAPDLCPRYAARYISGCRIAPSPDWLVKRLAAVGMRSINNVVDVTNLVMMELGHPLHAFDCSQLAGSRIVVRRAGEGENFVTLDNQNRVLTSDDLVICDAERPVALAGIMGGLNSEIADSTTTILLESAWFKPAAIRRTSKRLGLHTESSHRFERGADIGMVTCSLDRAARLIAELAGGTVAGGVVDAYPAPFEAPTITLRPERVSALLGVPVAVEETISILQRLSCTVSEVSVTELKVVPPSYRIDIEREIDLVEEVARLKGFDSIPASMPIVQVISDRPPLRQQVERSVRNLLIDNGMNEVINFSFGATDVVDKLLLGADDLRRNAIQLANPLVAEQSVMRTTLLPGVLETVSRNMSFRSMDLKLFEIRRRYVTSVDQEMPHEPLCVCGAITGLRNNVSWNQAPEQVDFYDAKGIVENILEALNIKGATWVADTPEAYYHPGKSCSVRVGRDLVGSVGELHPKVQKNFGLEKPVFCFELDFDRLVALTKRQISVTAPSRFPDSTRDCALLVAEELPAERLLETVRSVKAREIEQVELFDLYCGAGIPAGFKSVAIRVRYRSFEKTLTDDEIAALHTRVVDTLVKKCSATIR